MSVFWRRGVLTFVFAATFAFCITPLSPCRAQTKESVKPSDVPVSLWVPDRFERALKNQSSSPSYLMTTVVNDATGETKKVCIEGTALFEAVRLEKGRGRAAGWTINQEDRDGFVRQLLKNKTRTYRFKNAEAWKMVQPVYTPDYLALVQSETQNQDMETFARRLDYQTTHGDLSPGDLRPGNPAAYAAAFAYVATERGLYVGRADFTGSLYLITPKRLADEAEEQRASDAAEQKRKNAGRAFAIHIPGYLVLDKSFAIDSADVSLLVLARKELYMFSVTLQSKKPALITDFRWFDPVNQKTNKPQNDWSDLLHLTAHIERLAQKHPWLRAWKNASPNRCIESQVFGTTPHNEWGDSIDKAVLPAWKDAGLGEMPYCELILRWQVNGQDAWAAVYLPPPGSHETRALVTSTSIPDALAVGAFWLDSLHFSSWPTADPRECVVVSPLGAWKRVKLPLRTPLRP